MSTQGLWRLQHVSVEDGNQRRLYDVSLEIPAGVTAILGASGAGKTTLLNLLVGFERPTQGSISANFASTTEPEKTDSIPCFWGPPDDGLWPHLTVLQHLTSVCPAEGEVAQSTAKHLLECFHLTLHASAYPATLSRGERSRLCVARAVASGARILVLDEPLSHVGRQQQARGWEALRDYLQQGNRSLVFATHQPELALREADHCVLLDEGRVLASGPPAELYRCPESSEIAELLGPGAWLKPAEWARWFNQQISLPGQCARPEYIEISEDETAETIVENVTQLGAMEEVTLRHAPTETCRTFTSCKGTSQWQAGMRVKLSWLGVWLAILLGCGCEQYSTDRQLVALEEHYWSVPAEGIKVPSPRAVTATSSGTIYVLDNVGRICTFDAEGKSLKQWWMPEYSVGRPERILKTRDGRLVIADTHYHRIVIFNEAGELLQIFGTKGEEPGEFIYPVAVAEDDRERLYVCEYGGNDRVQVFDRSGEYVSEFGEFGTGPGEFQRPSGIVWHEGLLYIADAFNNRIHVVHEDGRNYDSQGSMFAVDLHYPYDIAQGPTGDFYVVEYGAGRVTKFNAQGELVGRFGHMGTGIGALFTPWGLSVDAQGRVLVADTGNHRLVRWTFQQD